ncbi:MAG: hypothetical protein QM597_01840 [Aeromicrobium sp.]|uniref:hypothetical protein n=1 Tax=Aeromicrobium sp. TaxID=1871063 RepID=UPI0039E41BE1
MIRRLLISLLLVCLTVWYTPLLVVADDGENVDPELQVLGDEIAESLTLTDAEESTGNTQLALPDVAEAGLVIGDDFATAVVMDVPAEGTGTVVATASQEFTIYEGTEPETAIAVQPTADGARALIHISGHDAPERFEFPFGGDVT